MRYPVLVNALAVLFVLAVFGYADDCVPYRQPVKIRGKLTIHDENGYRQRIILNPEHAICVVDAQGGQRRPVAELETMSSGGAEEPERLHRLVGNLVVVDGMLMVSEQNMLIDVAEVEPEDAAGRDALTKQVAVEDVAAYDVEIVAGPRLTKDVREVGTGKPLMPSDAYAPHTMSASDVLYARCRDGYEMDSGAITPPDVGLCIAGLCGFPADPNRAKVLRMRCVKTPAQK